MKLLSIILFSIFATEFSFGATEEWNQFKLEHGRTFKTTTEENYRKMIFEDNLWIIKEHNKKFSSGQSTFEMGITQFADMLPSEYQQIKKCFKKGRPRGRLAMDFSTKFALEDLPKTVNWVEKGAVTGVKNQLTCGACWAFATAGSVEGHCFIKKRYLVSLSAQNLIDCSTKNDGCEGGTIDDALQFIIDNKGIAAESFYPYQNDKKTCNKTIPLAAIITDYVEVPDNDEKALQKAVALGPVAVGIDAGQPSFMLYKKGVYDEPKCTKNLDHAVLVVGYGTEKGVDYWLVKNQWGIGKWGDKGYIKMARNKNNQCGIATQASYPIV